jgi:hypothetical protein
MRRYTTVPLAASAIARLTKPARYSRLPIIFR